MGVGFPYAVTVAVFGGSAEWVALYLKKMGHEAAFYWYVTACIFASLVVYALMRDTKAQSVMDRHV
jgi:MHS family alpha-ketoglutarate permease-like MFS transporter